MINARACCSLNALSWELSCIDLVEKNYWCEEPFRIQINSIPCSLQDNLEQFFCIRPSLFGGLTKGHN